MSASVTLRTAGPSDAPAIHRLIADNLEVGHLLPRTLADVERCVARFVVAAIDDQVVGCAELAPLSGSVAEVRSLVVAEGSRGRRIGPSLVAQVATEGTARGFATLCAFTHEPAHFVRMGFTIVPHIWVPEKVAHDCTSCSLFRRCGQYAVMLPLRAGVTVGPERPAAVIHGTRSAAARRLPLRPVAVEATVDAKEAIPA
ncbi:MAG TPA: GNAT family N-acetyltransferase [Vicinamibacterales bacterium]|nr:GNAT family N-acetyltransferase [Vicinamibacterales bacterium]